MAAMADCGSVLEPAGATTAATATPIAQTPPTPTASETEKTALQQRIETTLDELAEEQTEADAAEQEKEGEKGEDEEQPSLSRPSSKGQSVKSEQVDHHVDNNPPEEGEEQEAVEVKDSIADRMLAEQGVDTTDVDKEETLKDSVRARICKKVADHITKNMVMAVVVMEAPQAVAQTVVDCDLKEEEAGNEWAFTTTSFNKATQQMLLSRPYKARSTMLQRTWDAKGIPRKGSQIQLYTIRHCA